MPYKAPHSCAKPGCPELTYCQYCKTHQAEANKQYDQYRRDKGMKQFYNSPNWIALRKQKLMKDPFCEECIKSGTLIKATAVDHIREIKDGGAELDINNLQSLCWSCHSRKSMSERNNKR